MTTEPQDRKRDLIEQVAAAIYSVAESGASWLDARMTDKAQHRTEAQAALAVFEAAQKPAEDERARSGIIAELRWLADAREKYQTETFPQIAREVQTARQLADILERETPVCEGGQGFGWIPSWMWDEWDQMASRRPLSPEPGLSEPQCEPTDAQVQAALASYWGYPDGYSRGQFEKMRAALRAAAEEGKTDDHR